MRSDPLWPILAALAMLSPQLSADSGPVQEPSQDPKPPQEPPQSSAGGKQEELPEMLVIGRQREQGVPEVPLNSVGSRDVIGPEELRRTGARDMNDLIQNLPAVSTRPYNGGEGAAPSFSTRGLPDDGLTEYIHVLIDGVPVSRLPYGWTAFSFLPVTTERVYAVDSIRGAFSVRYSPNTIGGVLNFITQPIPVQPRLEMRSTLGSYDYASTLLSVGGTSGNLGALLSYVDRRGEGFRRNGGFDQQDANLKLRLDTAPGSWLAASVNHFEDEHKVPGGLTLDEYEEDRFGNSRPINRFDGSRDGVDLVYHDSLEGGGWWEPFFYFAQTGGHLLGQRPQFGAPTTVRDQDTEDFNAAVGVRTEHQLEFLGMEHTLYGGARAHRDWIPSQKIREGPYPTGMQTLLNDFEYTLQSYSMHLDDTVEPVEGLTVTAGARLEWIPTADGTDRVSGVSFEDDFFDILPGLGASYLLTDQWALYANYFEGFRAPQVWGFLSAPVDANLEFEQGRSAELGTRVEAVAGLYGSVALWRMQFDDFGVFYTGFYENLGRIEANGVDVVLEWEAGEVVEVLEGLVLSGSITFQDSELQEGPNAGNETPYAWNQKAAWRASYAFDPGWSASVGGIYVGESFSDEANTEQPSPDGLVGLNPSWTVWDAQLARQWNLVPGAELMVAAGVTNLFDNEWFVHSRGGFFGGGVVAGAPRQYYVSTSLVLTW